MSIQQPTTEPGRVTLVESEACHFCEDAHRALSDLGRTYPLVVEVIDLRSEKGQHLIRAYCALMSPLVLLDGEFFSQGRLPRRKLAKVLDQRRAAVSPMATPGWTERWETC